METKDVAAVAASAAKEKKAQKITVLDMRKVCTFCDFFVIASGTSLRQVNAIAHAVEEELLKSNVKPLSNVPSADESGWVVIDYSDVVVHVFSESQRAFYDLENLWSDAKRVRIPRKPLTKS